MKKRACALLLVLAMVLTLLPTGVFAAEETPFYNGNAINYVDNDDSLMTASPTLQLDNITMEAWVKADTLSAAGQYIRIMYNGDSGTSGYGIYLLNNVPHILVGGRGDGAISGVTLTTSQWYHLAAVRNNGVWTLYVNGTGYALNFNTGASAPGAIAPGSTFTVGNSTYSNENFKGSIDEVRYWTVPRSAQEIKDKMYVKLQGNESGLLAYYNFDQAGIVPGGDNTAITQVTDLAGEDNNLTISDGFALTGSSSNFVASVQLGTFALGASAYSVSADGGSVLIPVVRTDGAEGSVTIHYQTADGTALAGTDYTAAEGSVTFAQGDTTKNIAVAILNAPLAADKTFTMEISGQTGVSIGATSAATVTITPPVPTVTAVNVAPATQSVDRGGTHTFTATVVGENSPAQTVAWTVEGGGASTTISSAGLLTIGADEGAAALTVVATATANPSISGAAHVTVTIPPETEGLFAGRFNAAAQLFKAEYRYDATGAVVDRVSSPVAGGQTLLPSELAGRYVQFKDLQDTADGLPKVGLYLYNGDGSPAQITGKTAGDGLIAEGSVLFLADEGLLFASDTENFFVSSTAGFSQSDFVALSMNRNPVLNPTLGQLAAYQAINVPVDAGRIFLHFHENCNDEVLNMPAPALIFIQANTGYSLRDLPTPAREGYTFQGWNTMPDERGISYDSAAVYNSNVGTNLYARWREASFAGDGQNAPVGVEAAHAAVNGGKGALTGTAGTMQYRTSADANTWYWCADGSTSVLPGAYWVRYGQTEQYAPSDEVFAGYVLQPAPPPASDLFTVYNATTHGGSNGRIEVNSYYPLLEYSTDGGALYTTVTENMISGLSAGTVLFRRKAAENVYLASPTVALQVMQPGEAPVAEAFTLRHVTVNGGSDGSVSGLDATMEYMLVSEAIWHDGTGGTISSLPAGEIIIQRKQTDTDFLSAPLSLFVKEPFEHAPVVTGTAATTVGGFGTLTGTTAEMEYNAVGNTDGNGDPVWAVCTDTATSVMPGVYRVRYKETAENTPSAPADVTVNPVLPTMQEYDCVYANGTALIITSTRVYHTTIYIDINGNGVVDDGEQSLAAAGVTNAPADGDNLAFYTVYGGGVHDITCDTHITLQSGAVWAIYGGGDESVVTGNASIVITGGSANYVSAGGRSRQITGNATVSISGGTVPGQLAGGSAAGTKAVYISGNPEIAMLDVHSFAGGGVIINGPLTGEDKSITLDASPLTVEAGTVFATAVTPAHANAAVFACFPGKTGYHLAGDTATGTVYCAANTDTAYTVAHYVMDTGGDYPETATRTQTLSGVTDSTLTLASLRDTGLEVENGIAYSHGEADGAATTTTTVLPDGSRVIRLFYARAQYVLTADGGAGITEVTGAGTYRYGKTVTLQATTGAGYTWSKWAVSNTALLPDSNLAEYTFAMPAGDVSLTAAATLNRYTASYAPAQHGSLAGADANYASNYSGAIEPDAGYAPPQTIAVTMGGAPFTDFTYLKATGAIAIGTGVVTGDLVVEGACTPLNYSVTYAAAGATPILPQSYTVETTSFALPAAPEKAGHTFTGWKVTTGAAGGTGLALHTVFAAADTSVTLAGCCGDVTLTAQWTPDVYALAFDANGGDGAMAGDTATYGVVFTLPACGFTPPAGLQFKMWAMDSPAGTGAAAGSAVSFTADTTLYALWEDIPSLAACTVTYNANGGTGTMASGTVARGATLALPSCTFAPPVGKQFKHWAIGGVFGTRAAAGEGCSFTADTTVYAIWDTARYTVTFHANGGTGAMTSATALHATALALPSCTFAPPAGKQFKHWAIGSANSGEQVAEGSYYTFTASTPVYALWEDIPADPVQHEMIEGQHGRWEEDVQDGLSFTADGDYDRFVGVLVDGVVISGKDYTSHRGSTVVTLTPAYLKTLAVGLHTLEMNFTDGYCRTDFTIYGEAPQETGRSLLWLWIAAGVLAAGGFWGFLLLKRREKQDT